MLLFSCNYFYKILLCTFLSFIRILKTLIKNSKSLVSITPSASTLICILPSPSFCIGVYIGAISSWSIFKGSSASGFMYRFMPVSYEPISTRIPDCIFSIPRYVVRFIIDEAWLQFIVTKFALWSKPTVLVIIQGYLILKWHLWIGSDG